MLRVPFIAGVLFTAAFVTSGTADAHLGRHHAPTASRSIRHQRHGTGFAHLAASHRRHVAAHRATPRYVPPHRLAPHRSKSRYATADRHGGAPPPVRDAPAGAQTGGASYYGGAHRTAAGGHVGVATCAHRTLPFGTRVLVTNLANARATVLTVNDRGPFVRGRIVDVSTAAAGVLGMLHAGVAQVRVRVIGPG